MKVAVVSSDGKVINQHFGNASRFLIFEVDCGEIQFIEIRETMPLCGSAAYGNKDDALCRIICLIKDCEVVLCARIGRKPREELRKNGINPLETPYFIHEALKDI
jgi:predicted Fe-Mo cluster-binding NifX family protein